MMVFEIGVGLMIICFSLVHSKNVVLTANSSLLTNGSSNLVHLLEDKVITLNISLVYSVHHQSLRNKTVVYRCWLDDLKVSQISNWSDVVLSSALSEGKYVEVKTTIIAKRLGGSHLQCAVAIKGGNETIDILHEDMVAYIIVRRVLTVQEVIFRFVVMFFVIFLTFVMGCGLEREIIINYLRRPVSPAIGFMCQFIFMPIISFGLSKLTNIENAFGFGLLTIGCSPGGGASNIWTVLFGGDLNLSMTMTFISSCSALFMMPFWLFVLGRFFIDPAVVKVPYQDIGLNLLQVVIPVGFGMLFRWKFEAKAILLAKKVKFMGLLFVIFIFTFGSYANWYIFKLMGEYPYLLPIGASLPWLGFIFGLIMSLVTRRSNKQAIAISIETGFQNIGIAVLILKFSMPQPNGDLGAVMPIIVALFTPIPLYFALIGLTIKRKCCGEPKIIVDREMSSMNKDQNETLMDDKTLLPV